MAAILGRLANPGAGRPGRHPGQAGPPGTLGRQAILHPTCSVRPARERRSPRLLNTTSADVKASGREKGRADRASARLEAASAAEQRHKISRGKVSLVVDVGG